MDRGLVLICGGVILTLMAIFIPLTELQKSKSVSAMRKGRKLVRGSKCLPFQPPRAEMGNYTCYQKPNNNGVYFCRLRCPAGMQMQPAKKGVMYRCKKGRWSSAHKLQKFHCVAALNVDLVEQQLARPELINRLLTSYLNHSYNYLTMAYVFDRADVQLPGFHKYFLGLWETNLNTARSIMSYLNKRGGWINLHELPRSRLGDYLHISNTEGTVGLKAFEMALAMERDSQHLILDLVKRVENHKEKDPHFLHFLKGELLNDKVKIIKEMVDYITHLRSSGQEDYVLLEYEVDNVLQ